MNASASRGLMVGALLSAVAGPASAFELVVKGVLCGGHEFLSTQAARAAGIDGRFARSFELGARYVDMGGMVMAKDWLLGHMKEEVHRGPGVSHNHFCLRGGASDLPDLIRDAAARIRYLFERALEATDDQKVSLLDGGLLVANEETGHARYILLGAALHTVQDSFAHGYRTPVAGNAKLTETAFATLYKRIQKAVLVPEPKAGTLKHNVVYSKKDGSPHKSDQIFNKTACQLSSNGVRDLQPHAYAALLASTDLLRVFKAGAAGDKTWPGQLDAFMARWFADAAGKFPGYGREYGKCASRADCKRRLIPGEPGYVKAKTVAQQLGSAVTGATQAAGQGLKDGAAKAKDGVQSTANKAKEGARSAGKKAKEGGKKVLKKLGL